LVNTYLGFFLERLLAQTWPNARVAAAAGTEVELAALYVPFWRFFCVREDAVIGEALARRNRLLFRIFESSAKGCEL
jgi:hypothetical protein